MHLQLSIRGASDSDAPFALRILLLASLLLPYAASSDVLPTSCNPPQIEERVLVSYVYDGDTVKLSDGRRVRLIGINTPEMGHHDAQQAEPYAEAARASLQVALQDHGNMISLQYGQERKDRYGRLLAHAYLDNGEDVAVALLRQGLATTLVIPPNTATASCYSEIEREARNAGRGLWQLAAYHAQAADTLPEDTRGFRIVRGRVTGITRTHHQVRVALEGKLVASISYSDLGCFEQGYLDALPERTVELRGWIKPDRNGLRVRVRHPAALTLVTDSNKH